MVTTAWGGAADADVVCLLIDAQRGMDEGNEAILEKLSATNQTKILILNKIDTIKPEKLLALAQSINARLPFKETFMVSALTGSGVDDLLKHLGGIMPVGPWLYPEDQISDAPLRSLAAEITREKLFLRLHDELPYQSTVETTAWTSMKDGSARIEQTIFVTREGHKKIVIGKGGETIKAISMAARKEISEIAEAPVHLFLFVKVRENWSDDPERYREMGLEFPVEKR
jgi:GTP-binding protein Era